MDDKKKYLIFGGIALVIIFLLFKRSSGGGSPTIITSGGQSTTGDPIAAQVALAQSNAGMFGKILDYSSASKTLDITQTLGLARINASGSLAENQNSLDAKRLDISREVALAGINASIAVADKQASNTLAGQQLENARQLSQLSAMREIQKANSRQNAIQSGLSNLAKLLEALKKQQGSGTGAGGGSPTSTPPFVPTQRNAPRQPTNFIANFLNEYFNRPLEVGEIFDPYLVTPNFWEMQPYYELPNETSYGEPFGSDYGTVLGYELSQFYPESPDFPGEYLTESGSGVPYDTSQYPDSPDDFSWIPESPDDWWS